MAKSDTFLKFGKDSEQMYADVNDRGFSGKLTNIQIFMMAASIGYSKNRRVRDFTRASNGPRTTIREEHLAFLNCLHMSATKDVSKLVDLVERDKVAEEFAEGGIRVLHEKLHDPNVHSFVNWVIAEMRTSFSKK